MWGQPGTHAADIGNLGPNHRAPAALRSVSELPACFQPVYANSFRQSDCFDVLLQNDSSMVVAAPTGGGKTTLLELAILRLLSRSITPSGEFSHQPGSLKAIYLAPAKALVQEKVSEWTEKFGQTLGLSVKEVTGDTDQEDLTSIDSTDIVCTTPEKFDAMTRRNRARGGMRFFGEIALVLIDEVHLLSEGRGSCLEAGVVSRIKLVACKPEMAGHPLAGVRFVAVSATVPNAGDLAEWLGAPPQNIKVFGDEMRPVRLTTTVKGFQKTNSDFLFDRRLTDKIWPVLMEFNRGKPALVFCPSRAGTSSTALHLAREAVRAAGGSRPSSFLRDPAHHARLVQASANLADAQLKECLVAGVGFHHAAMDPAERAAVEALFRASDLAALCTTSTLAVGVNLPAFLVIVKGTRRYAGTEASDPSGYEEYDRSTVLQMVGRAGRPQFDTEGAAVIMTERDNTQRYHQLLNSAEKVESTLHQMLPEYLNAEIALGTVTDLPTAITWLKSTYLYVRIRKEPGKYGVPAALHASGPAALERWLREEMVMKTAKELATHGMVCTDEEGYSLEPLQPGVIMAEQYVKLPTMIALSGCPVGGGVPQLLQVIAGSSELSSIKLRRNEKKILNAVNKSDALRHHVMSAAKSDRVVDRISTAADKIFILINHSLSDAPPEKLEYSLRQDAERAVTVGARLTSAMVKYFFHEQRAAEAFNGLLLQKSLKQRLWTGSRLEARQISGVGPVIAERLAGCGIHTLRQAAEIDPRRLETLAQKAYPWGSGVQAALKQCLPPELELTCTPLAWVTGGCIELEITLSRKEAEPGTSIDRGEGRNGRCPGKLLVGSLHDNALLGCRSLCLSSFTSPLQFKVKTKSPAAGAAVQVVASVVHETLVGVDMAVKTVVPPGSRLDGRASPPAASTKPQQHSAAPAVPVPTSSTKHTASEAPITGGKRKGNPEQPSTVQQEPASGSGTTKPKPKGQKTMKQQKLPASLMVPQQLTRNLAAAQRTTVAPLPLSDSTAAGGNNLSAATPAKDTSAAKTAAVSWNQFISPPSAISTWRGPAPAAAGARGFNTNPPRQPAPAPALQRQPRGALGETGRTLAPAFGHFAFNNSNSKAPTPQKQVKQAGLVATAKFDRQPQGSTASTSGGAGIAAGAPPMATKRLKLGGSSLNWLSSKFQSVDRGARSGDENKNAQNVGQQASGAMPAVDIDASQALGFL